MEKLMAKHHKNVPNNKAQYRLNIILKEKHKTGRIKNLGFLNNFYWIFQISSGKKSQNQYINIIYIYNFITVYNRIEKKLKIA